MGASINYPQPPRIVVTESMSNVVVNYPEPTTTVIGDDATTVTITSAAAIGPIGPVGPTGPQGPSGPEGPIGVPDFFESSTPPLGVKPGDQWIVTTEIGEH